MTYRIKSPKSNISKLEDYLSRIKLEGNKISMKDFSDLVGLRLIIEKIPHNISISKDNPDYEHIQQLKEERKLNIQLSETFHDFEESIENHTCTAFDYYSKSAELVKSILNMINLEEYPEYSKQIKKTYNSLLSLCNDNLTFYVSR